MSKKLLLADDSITIQKVIGITFAQGDYALTVVGDGDSALEKARAVRPDLILADVFMPGKNGYELCAALKQDPDLHSVPVLLLAGTFEPFDEGRAAGAGADGWISKPFESQVLVNKVEALLARADQEAGSSPGVSSVGIAASAAPEEAVEEDFWSDLAALEAPEGESEEPEGLEEAFGPSLATSAEEEAGTGSIPEEDFWGALDEEPVEAGRTLEDPFAFDAEESEPVPVVDPFLPEVENSETTSDPFGEPDGSLEFAEELEDPFSLEDEEVAEPFAYPEERPAVSDEGEDPFAAAEPEEKEQDDWLVAEDEEDEEILALDDSDILEDDLEGESLTEITPGIPVAPGVHWKTGDDAATEGPEDSDRWTMTEDAPSAVEEFMATEETFGPEKEEHLVFEGGQDVAGYGGSDAASSHERLTPEDVFAFSLEEDALDTAEPPSAEPVPEKMAEPEVSTGRAQADSSTVASPGAVAKAAEEKVAALSDEDLARIVEKVAGSVIERLAQTMLERIAWEVVPDLAESMIKDEIRKIREEVQ